MIEHFKFVQAHTTAHAEDHDPGAVGALRPRRRRRRSTRRSIPRSRRSSPTSARPTEGGARLRGRRLPLSAARRGVHRHAVRSEIPPADEGRAATIPNKLGDRLRRPDQRRDVGHPVRHDDHHASVPRQLPIDLHGRGRLRAGRRKCCSTRSRCTAISWSTTTSAPAVSSRCGCCPRARPWCSASSPPRAGQLESQGRAQAPHRRGGEIRSTRPALPVRRNAASPRPRKATR